MSNGADYTYRHAEAIAIIVVCTYEPFDPEKIATDEGVGGG